jgi:hypothetical protein
LSIARATDTIGDHASKKRRNAAVNAKIRIAADDRATCEFQMAPRAIPSDARAHRLRETVRLNL